MTITIEQLKIMGLVNNNGAAAPPSPTGREMAQTDAAPNISTQDLSFDLEDYRAEDGGILDCWCDLYGDEWIYVTGHDSWYRRHVSHWVKDEGLAIQKQVQALMNAMNLRALENLKAAFEDLKEANDAKDKFSADSAEAAVERAKAWLQATRRSKNRVASVEGMARAQRAVPAGKLDTGNLLNLCNGTLDLDTLMLRPHNPADNFTYVLPYSYDVMATAPRFKSFVCEVLGDYDEHGQWVTDNNLCNLFHELMGYSLTNDTRHEVMTWLSGDGGNGKTVAITVILWLLGKLACSINFQTIGMPGNYDLSDIPGKRVIFSTEAERGGKVAENYLKNIVSGEQIKARPIYGSQFDFIPQAKVWWAMNDKPPIKDTGNSIWRRLKLIPFNRTFTDQDKDPDLKDTLEKELSGILNLALDGLRRLRQQNGFTESVSVKEALKEYRKESNPVAQWMDECTKPAETATTLAKALYDSYTYWCGQHGRQSMNSNNFGRELTKLKVKRERKTEGMRYFLSLAT